MSKKTNISSLLRSVVITAVAIFSLLLNFAYSPAAFAGDNYSAATDTYQETRNPNRVSTNTEDLTKSNLDKPDEEAKGESIYERLVEKVDERREEALDETKK